MPAVDNQVAETIVLNQETDATFVSIKNELSQLMSNLVGIVRNQRDLSSALKRINEITGQYPDNQQDYNYKKINDLATVCRLICISALERKESRGGHVRSDYMDESPELVHHIIQENGKLITTEMVRNSLLK